jgi:tetratricopeptide (TPR) repeat protein
MPGNVDNSEAHSIVRWILDNADTGMFIITAPHQQQRKLADFYKSSRIAEYDYASHGEAYSYNALSEWVNTQQDADVLFILNMQVALRENKNLADFNMSRDMLARKEKSWVFFMTKDLQYRLSTFAHDIYSYVRMKAHFQAEEESDSEELQDFHDRQNVQKIKAMLEQYKAMEAQLMSLSLHDTPDNQLLSAAVTLTNIAELYRDCAEYGRSFELCKKTLQIREKVLGKENPDTATAYNNLAEICQKQGDYTQALELYKEALIIKEKVLGKEHPSTAITYNNIASVYDEQGEYTQALQLYKKALIIEEKALGKEHLDTATTYNNSAIVYRKQGDYTNALEWHRKALDVSEKLLGRDHPSTAISYNNIALVYRKQGDYTEALEWHRKALDVREKLLGRDHPDTANSYNNIAVVHGEQGDYTKALEWYIKSYKVVLRILGREHPYANLVRGNMEKAYKNAGFTEPFDKWLEQKCAKESLPQNSE